MATFALLSNHRLRPMPCALHPFETVPPLADQKRKPRDWDSYPLVNMMGTEIFQFFIWTGENSEVMDINGIYIIFNDCFPLNNA
jgi:hypothetical protein